MDSRYERVLDAPARPRHAGIPLALTVELY